jgi:hypothetical protein
LKQMKKIVMLAALTRLFIRFEFLVMLQATHFSFSFFFCSGKKIGTSHNLI